MDSVDIGAGTSIAENWVSLKFTHAGKEYTIELADSDR